MLYRDFALLSRGFALLHRDFALLSRGFALRSRDFALLSRDFTLLHRDFALLSRDFTFKLVRVIGVAHKQHCTDSMTIRVRFAPSPTGGLHLGGARTALYNFLYAKKHRGKFLVRFEDTDKKIPASNGQTIDSIIEDNTRSIVEDLRWLGIEFDGEPVLQSARHDKHREVADQLLKAGKAFRCYDSVKRDSKDAAHKDAHNRGDVFKSPWRDRPAQDAPPNADANFVVRLKVPREGKTTIDDSVKGKVTSQNAQIDDFVLLRSDGSPTYMLSVVVDDYDSAITHIIRGDDHLTNTFRQQALYDACLDANIFSRQQAPPLYAHIPMVLDEAGNRLSKRKGSRSVGEFRKLGYLPEALANFLLRLGWGHKDLEILSLQQAIGLFDLEGLSAAPARISYARLEHLNAHYLRILPQEELQTRLQPFLPASADDKARSRFFHGLEGLRQRATTLVHLVELGGFYFAPPALPLDDAKAKKTWEEAHHNLPPQALPRLSEKLAQTDDADWQADALSQTMREAAQSLSLRFGDLAKPLRAVCTGRMDSPDLSEVLAVLGKQQTLERLEQALSRH